MSNIKSDLEEVVTKKLQEKNVLYKNEWVEESLSKFILKTTPEKSEAIETLESLDAEIVILKLNQDKRTEESKRILRDRLINAIGSKIVEEVEEISRIESVIAKLEKPDNIIKDNNGGISEGTVQGAIETVNELTPKEKKKYEKPVVLKVEKGVDECNTTNDSITESNGESVNTETTKNSKTTEVSEENADSESSYWMGKSSDNKDSSSKTDEPVLKTFESVVETDESVVETDEDEISVLDESDSSVESKEDSVEEQANVEKDKDSSSDGEDKTDNEVESPKKKVGLLSRLKSKGSKVDALGNESKKLEDSSENFIKSKSKPIVSILVCIVIGLLVGLVISKCVVSAAYVNGNSMYPTYEDGQMLFINRLAEPTRGSVVVIKDTNEGEEDHLLIKRVIGLPGEMLEIKDGCVYINGQQLVEGYLQDGVETYPAEYGTYENIGSDYYFVMGDNRSESKDSRYIGPINKKDIIGVVID